MAHADDIKGGHGAFCQGLCCRGTKGNEMTRNVPETVPETIRRVPETVSEIVSPKVRQQVAEQLEVRLGERIRECVMCGEGMLTKGSGRPRTYCSEACKKRAFRRLKGQVER